MKTDTSEQGLEKLIVDDMTSAGWIAGNPAEYDRSYAIDLLQLREFIAATQPKLVDALDLENDSPTRQKFLVRVLENPAYRTHHRTALTAAWPKLRIHQ